MLAAGFAAALAAGPATAATPDPQEAAAIATVQAFFDAMASQDADAVRAVTLPGGMYTSIRPGAAGATTVSRVTVEDFAQHLRPGLHEQMWSPRVSLRGALLATVTGPYEFQLDGKTTHCGIDVFDLAKVEGRWRVASVIWTAEPDSCAELKARK
ncbi:MAG: hypothetical protein JF588_02925 [Caulobacterales bacterium]|nr:hypothetical protein [Caulobacterales bacterium]